MVSGCGAANAKACDNSLTAFRQRSLPSSWASTRSWAARQQAQSFLWAASSPLRPVEAVEQGAAHVVLLQHHRHRFLLVYGGTARASTLRVRLEGPFQVLCQSQVVYHQTTRFVLEHPIDTGDGLHEAVSAHRLVNIHSVQARRVKTRKPHIPHQHDLQRIARVSEPLGKFLPAEPCS